MGGIWLQSFPEDDYIFELLKNYADRLEVEGEQVDVDDLNANAYTIRWYVFKCQSDAWHIDGRLVKKEGIIHVTKSFAGNMDAVAMAKESFSITASGTDSSRTLTLNNADGYDASTDTYTWVIDGVDYGEPWTITENALSEIRDAGEVLYHGHASYRVVDIYNTQNKSGTGTSVDVTGMTYAMDDASVQVLRVEFTNVYSARGSIVIKKEDERTGSPLGGATFRLVQNGEPLRFRYNSEKNQYIYDTSGTITEMSGSASGYYELLIAGFSYDDGNVAVQEVHPPPGYTPVENITVGYLTDPNTGQVTESVGIIGTSPMATYENGLLTVKNTTESISLTAAKQWECPETEWADITVQLLANGSLASSLIPGVEASAQLTAAGNWTHAWEGLPLYANGAEIVWTVRETRIGGENCKADFTFANWLVSYDPAVYSTDADGNVQMSITIHNDTKRTMLRLIKSTQSVSHRLPGATFMLELLTESGGGYIPDPTFVVRSMTTDTTGALTFDNLKYGYYRLTETAAPEGYEQLAEPIYLTILENGTVVVEPHDYAEAGSTAYQIHVSNRAILPLPETGGSGPGWFIALGAAMMLTALGGGYLSRKRKRGKDPTG